MLPPRDAALPQAPLTSEQEIDVALHNRPELSQLDYQKRINRRELEAKIIAAFPSVKGFIGVNTDSNDFLYHNQLGAIRRAGQLEPDLGVPPAAEKKDPRRAGHGARGEGAGHGHGDHDAGAGGRARYQLYGSELDTARHQHAIQNGIMGQINGGYKAGAVSQQTLLREQMNSLVTEVKFDIAYADAQNAYANLYAAMGLDNYTPNVAPDRGVHEIAGDLRSMWARRETFAGRE